MEWLCCCSLCLIEGNCTRLLFCVLPGHLSEPQQQAMPEAYSGRLLALAATADGSALAAAGEAVPASTLRPARPQQQQQQDASAGLSNAGDGLGFKPAASSAAVPAETATGAAVTAQQASGAAVAAAAAAPAVVSRRRKGRSARPAAGAAAGAAVDLFNMTGEGGAIVRRVAGQRSMSMGASICVS